LLSLIALFMLMIYSKNEVNRTSTFKVIGNIKLHVKVGQLTDDYAAATDNAATATHLLMQATK
jgi:hypothetical protein